MTNQNVPPYFVKHLPHNCKSVHRKKFREICVQMELSGSVKETANTKIKADGGLMTCRKTRHRFLVSLVCVQENLAYFAEQLAVQNTEGCTKVYVAIDGTSLNIKDSTGHKGLGSIGTEASGSKGFIVQNSYAVDQDGIPCGILYQKYFTRPAEKCESSIWADTLDATVKIVFRNKLSEYVLIIMDRGYDCPDILDRLGANTVKIMIRATQDRKVCPRETTTIKEARKIARPVLEYLSEIPEMATIEVSVPVVLKDKESLTGTSNVPTDERRTCTLSLKSVPVNIFLRPKKKQDLDNDSTIESKREWLAPATVLLAEEVNAPKEYEPVRWMLWLNYDVSTPDELKQVISDYRMRWRIEEFHKIWKSSGTKVEETQARSAEMIEKIARISAIVASNLARMQRYLEVNPDAPATTCFSQEEVKGLQIIDKTYYKGRLCKKYGGTKLVFVMALLAKIGGYENGSKSKVGVKMLTRGYHQVMNLIAGMLLTQGRSRPKLTKL